MVAVKAHQANAFLKSAAGKHQAFLFFGSDAGLVSERAAALAKASIEHLGDGEILRLDDLDLDADPARLSIELSTVPMFGGRKVIRVATGKRVNTQSLKPMIEGPPLEGVLIVEAGNLKTDDGLRLLFEKNATTAAIACYADSAQDLDAVIRETLKSSNLSITPDARELLIERLGADRAMSRGEVEKLALYAAGQAAIEAADVDAIVGDAAELAIDRIVNAAASGQGQRAVSELGRALSAGESAQSVLIATERHIQRLHRVRTALDTGRPLDDAMKALKPAIHFKQKDAFSAQLRQWSARKLSAALTATAAAARATRTTGALDDLLVERLLMALAAKAREPV